MEKFCIQKPILLSFLLVLLLFFISGSFASTQNDEVDGRFRSGHEQVPVRVGLVLDLGSVEGKIVKSSVLLALSDFYAIHNGYNTRISLSFRNSHGEPLLALASAVDLLKIEGVEAIIGGNSLLEAKLLGELGEKARVPVVSLNSPVSLSLSKYSHLIQATHDSASEAKGITSFINGFDWNSVALVYEDHDDWRETMQLMVEHFHENNVRVQSKVGFTVSSSEDFVMDRLQKLKDLGTTVFAVHLSEVIATHLFPCAARLGLMGDGFAWILTAKSMNSFHESIDDFAEAMEGVVGFKSYIPMTKELQNFTMRLKNSLPVEEADITRLSISGVWAHDIAWALASAAEVTRTSNVSATLLEAITETRFKGFSGDFQLNDKKLLSDKFEIVNMIGSGERRIGFWNSNGSFSNRRHLSSTHNKLETIIWPGGSAQTPNGNSLRDSDRKKLRVLVTSSNRFPRLMKVETDPVTNELIVEGFCIEVFRASISPFNYEIEYIPWLNGSNYDNLAYALHSQKDKYDAAVGDITITSNRSMYVDFTLPFTEMGLGIVAPKERSMWVFLQPLTPDLWITSAAFFVLTGIIVWLIERSENKEFQGSWSKQIGVALWFGFSTLVYAHRERLKHNLSRFVVTVWVFAVLILTASYTATLTSMMTVQQIRFNSNEDYVGHLSGSLIANVALTSSSLRAMRSLGLNSAADYAQALLNRTVSFVVDELPYLKVLLGENPTLFLMVKTQSTTNGFGFMFQKGFELVPNVSREIIKLRTSEKLNEMEKTWFDNQLPYTSDDTSNPITLYRFRGLFMITGVSFAFALAALVVLWLRDKREVLVNSVKLFLWRQIINFRIHFTRSIHPSPLDDRIGENAVQMAQHVTDNNRNSELG
ncbi:PREDICTED: glutamate receptor 1.3-like [Camelina sativa]|uniref:Glutamate receptor n=1 Tax=Camelina sativa TaxID=90675 RepID=A0ABM0UK08_CAMSA|nr:PREDICTED: glutamate receptor 1.3-like [Camelina sativa]